MVATEIVALRFRFSPALGTPIIPHFYEPFDGLIWFARLHASHDPRVAAVFTEFTRIVLAGTTVAISLAITIGAKAACKARVHSDAHGSAHWATPGEIRATGFVDNDDGVYVGAWQDGKVTRYLRDAGSTHVLAFAPTRSGKGVGLVLPTLLSWAHSVVVHDIKGENYALTAGWRARDLGSRIIKFDASCADGGSGRFNPLREVRVQTVHDVQDVQNIIGILCDPDGKGAEGTDAHWVVSATALLTAITLHALYTELEATLSGVADLLTGGSYGTPEDLLQAMTAGDHDPYGVCDWRDENGEATATHPAVRAIARDMLAKDPKELASVISTAVRYVTLFRDPIVAQNTATSDFAIRDLMNDERPVSLYLVIPPSEMQRLKPLTRLILTQILQTLTSEMRFEGGRSVAGYRHRLLLMIDELPSLGRLEILQSALAYMAGYGLKAYLIAQDSAQLQAVYGGPGAGETIMANCHVQIAYAPNKVETMELLSKLLGQTTVRNEQRTYSGSRFGLRGQVQVSATEMQRPLLTPDEVRRLPVDAALVLVAGHAPIYAKKIIYYTDRVFARRAKVALPGAVA